jgi:hypothetical protein
MSPRDVAPHPAWCVRGGECASDDNPFAQHESRWLIVGPAVEGDPKFQARLYASVFQLPEEQRPLVDFEVAGLDDSGVAVEVDGWQITALRVMFAALETVICAADHFEAKLPEVSA